MTLLTTFALSLFQVTSMVVGWSLLASVTLGHVVYYRPLPTDCPDTALTDSLLRHNDSFLYAQHLTGHFPDIKRQAAGSGSGGPRHWIKSSDTHSPPSSPGSDPTHAVSSRPSGNAGKLAAARTAPLGPRAASRSPKGKAEDGELGTAVINARRSPGVKAANSDLSQTDTRPGTDRSHGDQLNWSGNRGRVEVDRGRVEEDRGRVEEDRDRSGTRNDRLPAQTDTKYRTKSEGPWSAGQRTPSSDSGSETPHDVLEGSGASSRFPDPRVRLSSAQRGKLLNYLQSVSVLLGSNGDDLPPPDTATATVTANGTARWASRALHSLFHCFGAGPSHLVLLSHGAATSSGRPQRTHEDQGHGGNEERGLLVEDSTTLADADEKKRASHQRQELDEGWGSVGQSERRVARSVAVTKRPKWTQALARGAPLPWVCASSTKWRDLGLHVFPRYVQETSCGEDSSGDNHENATCWFGFYNCRPSTSSVQVLVRHTGSCNDSRVPQNMRRHYFLSIISVSTGCICR